MASGPGPDGPSSSLPGLMGVETLRRRPPVRSPDEGDRDGWARRRVARARPGDPPGADARPPGLGAVRIAGGDAVPPLPERADLRDARHDLGGLPRWSDARRRGPSMRAGDRRSGTASRRPSRSRMRRRGRAPDRRSVQTRTPSSALTITAPRAAALTMSNATTQGAQLGSAIGSRRPRSGSISPSHSRTTRSSRCGIRLFRERTGHA